MFLVVLVSVIFLLVFDNYLLLLIVLEIIGAFSMFFISYMLIDVSFYVLLVVFCILVIERVIAIFGFILIVRHSGNDYFVVSSILKC